MAELTDVTGSISDIGSLALSIHDELSAAEGLTYNLCNFLLKRPEQSAASPAVQARSGHTAAPKQQVSAAARHGYYAGFGTGKRGTDPFLSVATPGGLLWASNVQFTIDHLVREDCIVCTVALKSIDGFDTKIGNQLSVEFATREFDDEALLLIKGFVDPAGAGYAHFLGAVVVYTLEGMTVYVGTRPFGDMRVISQPRGVVEQIKGLGFSTEISSRTTAGGFEIRF